MAVFTKTVPVRFEDCDPAGIGFYPRILMMVNRLIEDFFDEALGYPWRQLHGVERREVPTVRLEVDFKGPLRQGDALTLDLRVLKVGRSAFTVAVTGAVGGDERFVSTQVLVYTTAGSEVAALPMPDSLRSALGRYHPQ